MRHEWLLGTAGVISILFGAIILASPSAGILTLIWLIAVQSIATGFLFIVIGLRVRSSEPRLENPTTYTR
jgi:uncharacterized membrane protein HdeD (DUF308 family)